MLRNSFKLEYCDPGSKTRLVGHLDVDHVVWDGEENLYDIIQSFGPQCDIEKIVARIHAGDFSALVGSRGEGQTITEEDYEQMSHVSENANRSILNLYNTFAGKDNLSFTEFESIIHSGDLDKLEVYIPKAQSVVVNKEDGGVNNA